MSDSTRSRILEVIARAEASFEEVSYAKYRELFKEQAAHILAALSAEGMTVVPGWQRAALGPWSEHGTYPHYVLVYNGKHVGVGFRISPNYDDDPEWCDEGGEFIEPPVQLWMPLPEPPASPYGKASMQEASA